MIIVRAQDSRVRCAWNVSIGEIDELLRLRDASVLRVDPRPIGNDQDSLRDEDEYCAPDILSTQPIASDSRLKPCKGMVIPHEVWSYMSSIARRERRGDKGNRDLTPFTPICRWWALHWRPILFEDVLLKRQADVYALADILSFETPSVPSLRVYVKQIVINHRQEEPSIHKYKKTLTIPWLHTFYTHLHTPLLANNPRLTIQLHLNGGRWTIMDYNPKRNMHEFLPRSVPTLHPRCHDLRLSCTSFTDNLGVVNLIRRLGVTRSVVLHNVDWLTNANYRPIPTTICTLSLAGPQCESLFALIAPRRVGIAEYLLPARDTILISDAVRALKLWPGDVTYAVEETLGRNGHICVSYWLRAEANVDALRLVCTADAFDEIPRAGKRHKYKKYLLKPRSITLLLGRAHPKQINGEEIEDEPIETDWPTVAASIAQLPTLERLLVGHQDEEFMHHFAQFKIDPLLPLARSDKLTMAYLTGKAPVRSLAQARLSMLWPSRNGETWKEVNARTLESTDNTCVYVHHDEGDVGEAPQLTKAKLNMRNLQGLHTPCGNCAGDLLE